MVERKVPERIYDSFEDKRNTIIMGVLCYIYFAFHFAHAEMVHLIPEMKIRVYVILGVVAFAGQTAVWVFFRHFHGKWYREALVILLFLCEYAMILFALGFMFWPFYAMFQSVLA